MNKIILIFSLIALSSFSIFAQKNNSIYLFTSDTWYRGSFIQNYNPQDQYGFGYKRNLNKHFGIEATYSKWLTKKRGELLYYRYEKCNFYDNSCNHLIDTRRDYQFLDIYISYKILNYKKYGMIHAKLGLGYAWGANTIVDTVILPTVPPYDVFERESHFEKARYLSIIPALSYDYFLWKKRINIGLHFKARQLFSKQQPFFQTEQGIHIGYNF